MNTFILIVNNFFKKIIKNKDTKWMIERDGLKRKLKDIDKHKWQCFEIIDREVFWLVVRVS